MKKRVLLVSYIDKGSIQSWYNLLDRAQINVPYREFIIAALMMTFHKPFVFKQGYTVTFLSSIYKKLVTQCSID